MALTIIVFNDPSNHYFFDCTLPCYSGIKENLLRPSHSAALDPTSRSSGQRQESRSTLHMPAYSNLMKRSQQHFPSSSQMMKHLMLRGSMRSQMMNLLTSSNNASNSIPNADVHQTPNLFDVSNFGEGEQPDIIEPDEEAECLENEGKTEEEVTDRNWAGTVH
eukprot:scaffold91255_cov75-Attheya_sp.AAC.3